MIHVKLSAQEQVQYNQAFKRIQGNLLDSFGTYLLKNITESFEGENQNFVVDAAYEGQPV